LTGLGLVVVGQRVEPGRAGACKGNGVSDL